MTPKEKAEELVGKFKEYSQQSLDQNTINEFDIRKIEYTGSRFGAMMRFSKLYNAKQCTLILIDEMLNNFLSNRTTEYGRERYHFWQEVKQEIEKL